jgi:hypothetical protein
MSEALAWVVNGWGLNGERPNRLEMARILFCHGFVAKGKSACVMLMPAFL